MWLNVILPMMLCVQSNCVQDNDFIQSMTLAKGKSPVITFKLASLVFRCLNGTAPLYLADSINCAAVVETRRSLRLRSSSLTAVDVPVTRRSTIGDRAFPVAAARAWNSLPSFVKSASSLSTFKRYLKTYLFAMSY